MSRGANLSLLALYNYDKTLFDGLSIPSGIRKEILINKIILDTLEFELLYPDPVTLKEAIHIWSDANYLNWQRMEAALEIEYNPLENYNRKENWTDSRSGTVSNETRSGSTSTATNIDKPDNTETVQQRAYNEGLTITDQRTINGTNQTVSTGNSSENSSGESTENSSFTHDGNVHGNIGVTTSQQMLESEIDLRSKYNIYNIIARDFRNNFCLVIY